MAFTADFFFCAFAQGVGGNPAKGSREHGELLNAGLTRAPTFVKVPGYFPLPPILVVFLAGLVLLGAPPGALFFSVAILIFQGAAILHGPFWRHPTAEESAGGKADIGATWQFCFPSEY